MTASGSRRATPTPSIRSPHTRHPRCRQPRRSLVGKTVQLTAKDGHKLDAYIAEPSGKARGAIVVIQEIFGVNAHMRETTDLFAKQGYAAISPALFDRAQKGVERGCAEQDIAQGRDIRMKCGWDGVMADMAAAVDWGKAYGKVGSVGYCWGGSVAYLCGTRLPVAAAVVYYGGQIIPFVDEKLKCATLMHFGELDKGIPLSDVDTIK